MNDPILQDIKDRLNVADVIASYIPIKKAGTNFKALCPFHHEKSPSLQISPQKQIWHCFGCGEGGDAFGFVMKYENLEFKDALKILADKAGVVLPAFRPQNQQAQNEAELLLRINDFAARYYYKILTEDNRGKIALEYLKNRGLTEGTIKQWQIGFAPDDFHALEQALQKKQVNLGQAIKAGVLSKNERGQMYDRFRGRVTFPILNYLGDIVGFSARILKDDGKSAHSTSSGPAAKYVNSPETPVYNKSKILFGLNFAKDSIRKADEAVIVEGQMDCIQAHQAGFKNVVASSGTALTEAALQQLGRLTHNLKFCFDADTAGQAASRRAGELALKLGFKLKVIVLEATKDPDELIKKSPGLWQKVVSEAVWFLDFYINLAEKNFPSGSVEQKHYLTDSVLPFLGYIQDPLEQDHYIHKMAERFLITEKVIRDQIKNQNIPKLPESPAIIKGLAPTLLLEKEVLGGLLTTPEFKAEVLSEIKPEDFEDADIRDLVGVALNTGAISSDNSALAKEAQFMLESQLEELDGNQIALKRELLKAFALLKLGAIRRVQQGLQNEIKLAEIAKNKTKTEQLNKQFADISAQRVKFETLL